MATWRELEREPVRGLLLPLGSHEQHGPHLPLDTDTRVAVAVAAAAAGRLPGMLTLPAFPYGASGEHAGFPGTLSLGTAALATALVELVRSADLLRAPVIVVNGHGGNHDALRSAAATAVAEGRVMRVWAPPATGGDAHAGRTETSLMLAIAAETVGEERPVGATAPLRELWPALSSGRLREVAPEGVLGDARGASADEGRTLLARYTDDLVAKAEAWLTKP
ncbi:MAG: mycofactocin biosynthesis peptidyl-dipeptidase MftE [Streptosporangiales bacterium]|nr:mycofactocin biosynthesis peptidyl-dipeptidase MftE [Streptosporangiales bacterium]